MADFEGRRGRFAHLPAVGFVGLMGALLASDFFRMGSTPASVGSRGVVMVATTICTLAIAALVGTRRNLIVGVVLAAFLAPLCGAALGVATFALTSTHGLGHSGPATIDGFVAGAVFLPAILLIVISNRHVGRAREGTIVDAADRRASYVAAATCLAIGAPIAVVGSGDAKWLVSLEVTLAVSALATFALLVAFYLDWSAVRKARAFVTGWETLEPQDEDCAVDESSSHRDLGLGEDLRGRVQRTGAYRGKPRIESTLRGEPAVVLSALRRGLLRTAAGLMTASVATAIAFSLASHTAQTNADPWENEIALDPIVVSDTIGQLPLSCASYFAMAGGCVERTVGSEQAHIARRLEETREAWVAHKSRLHSEALCTAALRDALDHPACVSEEAARMPHPVF